MRKYAKPLLAAVILCATFVAFYAYIADHPEVITGLKQLEPTTLLLLLLADAVSFAALGTVLYTSLRLYHKTIPYGESILITAYSALINFFGPGQSGIAARGVYLHRKHHFKIKHYMFATLLYYGFYSIVNVLLVCVGSRPWWQTIIAVCGVIIVSAVVIQRYSAKNSGTTNNSLHLASLASLFVATVCQIAMQCGIYSFEIQSTGADISLGQALSYTGVANLALFASLTPAAIGIREALLVFSQNIHHIDATTIVTANIIDRAAYLVFLGIVFAIVLLFHVKDKLHLSPKSTDTTD